MPTSPSTPRPTLAGTVVADIMDDGDQEDMLQDFALMNISTKNLMWRELKDSVMSSYEFPAFDSDDDSDGDSEDSADTPEMKKPMITCIGHTPPDPEKCLACALYLDKMAKWRIFARAARVLLKAAIP